MVAFSSRQSILNKLRRHHVGDRNVDIRSRSRCRGFEQRTRSSHREGRQLLSIAQESMVCESVIAAFEASMPKSLQHAPEPP